MMKDKGLHASMPLPQTGYPRYPHAIIIIIVISIYFKKDNIIILECGKIVERGTHKELLVLRGKYYETYINQLGMRRCEE